MSARSTRTTRRNEDEESKSKDKGGTEGVVTRTVRGGKAARVAGSSDDDSDSKNSRTSTSDSDAKKSSSDTKLGNDKGASDSGVMPKEPRRVPRPPAKFYDEDYQAPRKPVPMTTTIKTPKASTSLTSVDSPGQSAKTDSVTKVTQIIVEAKSADSAKSAPVTRAANVSKQPPPPKEVETPKAAPVSPKVPVASEGIQSGKGGPNSKVAPSSPDSTPAAKATPKASPSADVSTGNKTAPVAKSTLAQVPKFNVKAATRGTPAGRAKSAKVVVSQIVVPRVKPTIQHAKLAAASAAQLAAANLTTQKPEPKKPVVAAATPAGSSIGSADEADAKKAVASPAATPKSLTTPQKAAAAQKVVTTAEKKAVTKATPSVSASTAKAKPSPAATPRTPATAPTTAAPTEAPKAATPATTPKAPATTKGTPTAATKAAPKSAQITSVSHSESIEVPTVGPIRPGGVVAKTTVKGNILYERTASGEVIARLVREDELMGAAYVPRGAGGAATYQYVASVAAPRQPATAAAAGKKRRIYDCPIGEGNVEAVLDKSIAATAAMRHLLCSFKEDLKRAGGATTAVGGEAATAGAGGELSKHEQRRADVAEKLADAFARYQETIDDIGDFAKLPALDFSQGAWSISEEPGEKRRADAGVPRGAYRKRGGRGGEADSCTPAKVVQFREPVVKGVKRRSVSPPPVPRQQRPAKAPRVVDEPTAVSDDLWMTCEAVSEEEQEEEEVGSVVPSKWKWR